MAAGDCLGSLVEFMARDTIRREQPNGVREITGGGPFNWRQGQGTDDTDMTAAVLRSYLSPEGYSLKGVADNFVKWKDGGPRDIGGTTSSGISKYKLSGNPHTSGRTDDHSAANGSLMRCIPTGLLVNDSFDRAEQAAQISAITHGEPRAVDSCVAYCDMVNRMVSGDDPQAAIAWVLEHRNLDPRVEETLMTSHRRKLDDLDGSGYVLGSLGVAVWAVTARARPSKTSWRRPSASAKTPTHTERSPEGCSGRVEGPPQSPSGGSTSSNTKQSSAMPFR